PADQARADHHRDLRRAIHLPDVAAGEEVLHPPGGDGRRRATVLTPRPERPSRHPGRARLPPSEGEARLTPGRPPNPKKSRMRYAVGLMLLVFSLIGVWMSVAGLR